MERVPLSLVIVSIILLVPVIASLSGDEVTKIAPKLSQFYESHSLDEEVSFFAVLHEKADIANAIAGKTGEESGEIVFNELTKVASGTQGPLIALLESMKVEYKSFWIKDMILIKGNSSVVMAAAKHITVRELHPNFEFRVNLETPDFDSDAMAPEVVEWNINWVKAPQVWAKGVNGKGIVVANADTGVQWTHPALQPNYRGYPVYIANNITHDYYWWDSVHTTGSSCGANTKAPCDDNGHGTHTTGTSVGDDGGTNQIGVAPGAKWIACRNMNAGLGSPATYLECMQFFIAPTDLTGKNPLPALRPHVVGNSWGCPASEGCSVNVLLEAVTNTISAGIFMSVSAGNSGSSCSTINDPPAIYANVACVAASGYQVSTIASYSSRGPVTVDGSNRPKPDITAPGSTVRSSYPTNRYVSLSGTSMASPHITGMVALLWQARPELQRDISATIKILYQTAITRSATTCSSMASHNISARGDTRNNVYGYGELDALAAVNAAVSLEL